MVGRGTQKTSLKVCILCHQSYPYLRNGPASQSDATAFNNKICTYPRAERLYPSLQYDLASMIKAFTTSRVDYSMVTVTAQDFSFQETPNHTESGAGNLMP